MASLPRLYRSLLWLIWPCLLASVLQPALAAAQTSVTPATPLTLEDYAAQVHAALAQVEGGSLAGAQALFPPAQTVTLPGRYVITVESPLAGLTGEAGLTVARTRLALLRDQLEGSAGDRTAERLAVLAEVLSRPEFTGEESWLLRWLREFFEWLRSLLPEPPAVELPVPNAPALPPAPAVNWIGVGAVSMLAVVLLALLLRWGVRSWLRSRQEEDGAAAEEPGDEPATPEAARAQAVAFAAEGNFRAAVRRLYLAALLTLQQRAVVSSDASLTNLELLAKLRSEDPVRPLLAPVVTTFDEVWYGATEPDAGHFQRYAAQVDALAAGSRPGDLPADDTPRREAP
jgi:hypothetical protein